MIGFQDAAARRILAGNLEGVDCFKMSYTCIRFGLNRHFVSGQNCVSKGHFRQVISGRVGLAVTVSTGVRFCWSLYCIRDAASYEWLYLSTLLSYTSLAVLLLFAFSSEFIPYLHK